MATTTDLLGCDIVERDCRKGVVVCVSPGYISIRWDTGTIFPLTTEELEE